MNRKRKENVNSHLEMEEEQKTNLKKRNNADLEYSDESSGEMEIENMDFEQKVKELSHMKGR